MNEKGRALLRGFYDGSLVTPIGEASRSGRVARWAGTAALAAAMGASMVLPASAMDSADFLSRVEAAARLDNPDHVSVTFFERLQGEAEESAVQRLAGEISSHGGISPASALETARASLGSVESVQGAAAMYIRSEQTVEESRGDGGAVCYVLRSSSAPGIIEMETGSHAEWAVGPVSVEADRRLTFLHETNHCLDHRYFAALFRDVGKHRTETEAIAVIHGLEETAEAGAVYAGMLMGVPREAIEDRIAARAAQNAMRQLRAPVLTGNRDADAIFASAGIVYDLASGMRAAERAAQQRLGSGRTVDTASAEGLRDILSEGRRIGSEKGRTAEEVEIMQNDLSRLRKALPQGVKADAGLGDGRAAGALLSKVMELPVFAECDRSTKALIVEGARGLSRLYGNEVLTERARIVAGQGGADVVFAPDRPSDIVSMAPGAPLSLPLRADAVSGLWSRAVARFSPEDIARSYNATRLARDAVAGKDEAAAVARDGLELGRRLLGAQMRASNTAGIGIDTEKADRRALSSMASSGLPDWMRTPVRAPVRTAELSR